MLKVPITQLSNTLLKELSISTNQSIEFSCNVTYDKHNTGLHREIYSTPIHMFFIKRNTDIYEIYLINLYTFQVIMCLEYITNMNLYFLSLCSHIILVIHTDSFIQLHMEDSNFDKVWDSLNIQNLILLLNY